MSFPTTAVTFHKVSSLRHTFVFCNDECSLKRQRKPHTLRPCTVIIYMMHIKDARSVRINGRNKTTVCDLVTWLLLLVWDLVGPLREADDLTLELSLKLL